MPPPVTAFVPTPAAATSAARSPIDPKAYAAAIAASGARVDVFECLSRAFHLWTNNFFPLVGATLLVCLVQLVIAFIPILGNLAGLVLNGVFYGGLYYYYLGKMRGQPREIGDAFGGFSRAFGPLALTTLLQSAIMIALMVVFMAPILGFIISMAIARHSGADAALPVLAPPMIALICVGALLMIYVGVSLCFGLTLVIDKGLGPWDALVTSWRVVTRNWFSVFFTMILSAILASLGLIVLFVGILFTLPLAIAALLYAYEALFSTPEASAALEASTKR